MTCIHEDGLKSRGLEFEGGFMQISTYLGDSNKFEGATPPPPIRMYGDQPT